MATYELAFIGAGNMAEAIARGVLAAGLIDAGRMIAADPAAARRELFGSLGIATTEDNAAAAADAECLLLAVKPQQTAAVLAGLAGAISPSALVVSIVAGVATAKIEAALADVQRRGAGEQRDRERPNQSPKENPDLPLSDSLSFCPSALNIRVVRVMPNTPALVGAGMAALVKGSAATDADLARARALFDACGRSLVVSDESLMDAVTAVSGSGPAYFFYLVEQMVAGGVAEGLGESDALALAVQTAVGAAKLLAESGQPPRELRRRVTSPGGTTQAACDLLDARGAAEAVRDAVRAAAARSRELGR